MRVSSLVGAVLLGLVLVADAVRPPPPPPDNHNPRCTMDLECRYWFGDFCFCLKPPSDHTGHCICNMDPNILKGGCQSDRDCASGPYQSCYCKKDNPQAPGLCNCVSTSLVGSSAPARGVFGLR